jgi:hypothetical protein
MGIDVTGQDILELDGAQGLDITGIGGTGAFRRSELGTYVAGEIQVGGVPGLGVGVLVDQVVTRFGMRRIVVPSVVVESVVVLIGP